MKKLIFFISILAGLSSNTLSPSEKQPGTIQKYSSVLEARRREIEQPTVSMAPYIDYWIHNGQRCSGIPGVYIDQLNNPDYEKPPTTTLPKIKVIHINPEIGYGVIAEELIQAGDFIIPYIGEIKQTPSDQAGTNRLDYSINITKLLINKKPHLIHLDATHLRNEGGFTNHNFDGNSTFVHCKTMDGFIQPWLVATRNITPGEEITWDYGINYWWLSSRKPANTFSPTGKPICATLENINTTEQTDPSIDPKRDPIFAYANYNEKNITFRYKNNSNGIMNGNISLDLNPLPLSYVIETKNEITLIIITGGLDLTTNQKVVRPMAIIINKNITTEQKTPITILSKKEFTPEMTEAFQKIISQPKFKELADTYLK